MTKNKIKIKIDSDGTIEGTKLVINGEDITATKQVTDMNFWANGSRIYQDGTKYGGSVSCGYSTKTRKSDGSSVSESFRFSPQTSSMEEGVVGKPPETSKEVKKDSELFIGKNSEIVDKILAFKGKVKRYVPEAEELNGRTQDSLQDLLTDLEREPK